MAKFANRLVHLFRHEDRFDPLQPLFEDPQLTERLQVSCLYVTLYYERKAREIAAGDAN